MAIAHDLPKAMSPSRLVKVSWSPFCQVTKFVSWTNYKPTLRSHIKNLLSPCCQVHFTKSPSSYHELVESMLSSPFCQVTKFVSWTCWVHIVKSMSPITNSMSSWPCYHVDCMNVFWHGKNIF
jgi:hypothetical protein